jgi:peptidyl-dipeptidase Dcp
LAAHTDTLYLNEALYARVQQLFDCSDKLDLDAESKQLLKRYQRRFVRAGARLPRPAQTELRAINERLATATNQFQQVVAEDAKASAIVVESADELRGLSVQDLGIAAKQAQQRGLDGKYVISLVNTTGQPILSSVQNRELRERILKASLARGLEHGASAKFSALELVSEILRLRARRAALLGYPTHAAYVLEDETAQAPAKVNAMLDQLVPSAVANAQREAAALQALIQQDADEQRQAAFELAAWDWDYYAARLRKALYEYDEAEVKPYFESRCVLDNGVLFAASKLYGLRFEQRGDLPTYQSDVLIFEVFEGEVPLGLCVFDWFARDNKRGGAWMDQFVRQSGLLQLRPVVVNNLNVQKAPPGQPTLMSFDEVTTAFHEFGHALHGLLASVQYPSLSGTLVPRDFVEYPSQFNEMWATDPQILANYARHHETGQAMPPSLLNRVISGQKFNQGYATTEYLAAAILDQALHQLAADQIPAPEALEAFEAQVLAKAGIDVNVVPPRYRTGYFSHVFADPTGYSAGYYAYVWAEVLARDTEDWFKRRGGLNREGGERLRNEVLSRGFTRDPLEMFEAFKGGPPEVKPLLRARGLTPAATA